MPASIYLALAYLKPRRSIMTAVNIFAVLGITIGVATLVIVNSVMMGFGDMWKEKFLSFIPHVAVFPGNGQPSEEDHPRWDLLQDIEGVANLSPFVESKVFAKFGNKQLEAQLRGVHPQKDYLLGKLRDTPDYLISGTLEFDEEECIIGHDLARELGVWVGDHIVVGNLVTIFGNDREIRLPEELRVVGIFNVGMWQIDRSYIVTDMETARDVLAMDDGIVGVQIMLNDVHRSMEVAQKINLESNFLIARPWMEWNRQLFNALGTEQAMMRFLMGIISVVASFLVCSTLIMMSVQKTREVGLLKAMGYRNGTIMRVFMCYGLVLGMIGNGLGIALGLTVLKYRQDILEGLEKLAGGDGSVMSEQMYFLEQLPATTTPESLVQIGLFVMILCLVVGAIPAYFASRKHPVEALRHE